jgi:hypothetical protein
MPAFISPQTKTRSKQKHELSNDQQGSIQNAHCYPHFPGVARLCSKDIADWYLFLSDLVVGLIIIVSVFEYISQLKAVFREVITRC